VSGLTGGNDFLLLDERLLPDAESFSPSDRPQARPDFSLFLAIQAIASDKNALIASTRQVSRAEIDDDPAQQQGQDIEREPFNARPFGYDPARSRAFEKKQVDGVAGGARADVETEDDAERAVNHGIAGKPMALIEPQAVNRGDQNENPQQLGFPAVVVVVHVRFQPRV